jgi:hypothetical protein
MTSISIFIYGWLIDPDKIMDNNKKVNENNYEDYISQKTKNLKIIQLRRNYYYESCDYENRPYYVYLNYIPMCDNNCIITNDDLKALSTINQCENNLLDLNKEHMEKIKKDLGIDLKNPQIYIDNFDIDRKFELI